MSNTPRPLTRRLADLGVIGVFAAVLGVVAFGTLFREPPPFDENRERHPPPPPPTDRQTAQQYPKWFDLYFADRVGYRDVMLRWHRTALSQAFNEEDEKKAWAGTDGWLYLNVADPDEFRDDRPKLDARLDAWADELAARAKHLKGQGIEYVVLLAPEKSSVYPEHLPERVRQHPPPEPLAGMTERLRARGVRAVNPLPALMAAKADAPAPLYFPQDTHWTQSGARVAYRELAKELQQSLPGWTPRADAEYTITEVPGVADLRRIVRKATGPIPPATNWATTLRITKDTEPAWAAALPKECRSPNMPPQVFTNPDATGPAVLVFRDSFGEQTLPFVAADFRRAAVVLSDTLEPAALAAEKPAVVIHITVGRKWYMTPVPERRYR